MKVTELRSSQAALAQDLVDSYTPESAVSYATGKHWSIEDLVIDEDKLKAQEEARKAQEQAEKETKEQEVLKKKPTELSTNKYS